MVTSKSIEIGPGFQVATLPDPPTSKPLVVQLIRGLFPVVGTIFPKIAGQLAYRFFTHPQKRAVHRRSDEVLESARITEIRFGKTLLKTYEWGTSDKVVLLVHGWESRGTALRSFVPGLLEAGYRVVAFDGPGHGNSGGTRTNLIDFAGAVKAVIRQTGNVEALITHSFGGASSVFALAHLDNTIEIDKLVLIGVPSSTQKVVQKAIRYMNVPSPAARHFNHILKRKMKGRPLKHGDVEHSLQYVHVNDVLVVHDKFDKSVPFESAERVFESYSHANLLVTRGLGHYSLMKDEKVVDRVVRFVVSS